MASWNSFAQIYNAYEAARALPEVLSHLGGFAKSDSSDNKGKGIMIVVLLVIVALTGGILTTRAIIMSTARRNAGLVREEYAA